MFTRFFEIYWKLKGSKPFKKEENTMEEIDLKRVKMFQTLSNYLNWIWNIEWEKPFILSWFTFFQLCKERMEYTDFSIKELFKHEITDNKPLENIFDILWL